MADLIDGRVEELAKVATVEMGKLIAQSRSEVGLCAQIARYYAENAERFLAPTRYPSELGEAWVEHHPIGVLVAVEPWNFPYYQLMRVLAPNLAAGNPVLVKHASNVPHCATLFEQLVTEAGAPQGTWTNLFVSSEQISTLIADDRVQGAALTGSEPAGSAVAQQAGKYLKKTTLELGGNDVFVVLDDADLDKAVAAGAEARLSNCGQVCTAAKRFLVHEKVADQFLKKFTAAFEAVKIGDPLDESTTLGPSLPPRHARGWISRYSRPLLKVQNGCWAVPRLLEKGVLSANHPHRHQAQQSGLFRRVLWPGSSGLCRKR